MKDWISAALLVVCACVVACGSQSDSELQETIMANSAQATLTAPAGPAPTPATCPETAHPWDTSWLPRDPREVAARIDDILQGSGLAGQGSLILHLSIEYGVNPAFALAMFRKEANLGEQGTRAERNNNPGNIIATGGCRGEPAGQGCTGYYGETGTDGRFGVYPSMADGIEAYFKLLDSEYKPGTKRDCDSMWCIISAYCPPEECETDEYVAQIAGWSEEYQCELLQGVDAPAVLAPRPTAPEVAVTVAGATAVPSSHTAQVCSIEPDTTISCGLGDIVKVPQQVGRTTDGDVYRVQYFDVLMAVTAWDERSFAELEEQRAELLEQPVTDGHRQLELSLLDERLTVFLPLTVPQHEQYLLSEGESFVVVEILAFNEGHIPQPLFLTGFLPCYLEDGVGEQYPFKRRLGPLNGINTGTLYTNPGERIRTLMDFVAPAGATDLSFVCESGFGGKAVINLGATPIAVGAPAEFQSHQDQPLYHVGDTVELPEGQIFLTVDQVTSPARVEHLDADPGMQLIVVDVTLENRGSEPYYQSGAIPGPSNPVELKDSLGWRYSLQWASWEGARLAIGSGEKISERVVFEVPEAARDLRFVFQTEIAERVFVSLSTLVPSVQDGKVYLDSSLLFDIAQDAPGCFEVSGVDHSPTLEHFIVNTSCLEGENHAVIFRADGSDRRSITEDCNDYMNYSNYAWSPDGRYLFYERIGDSKAPCLPVLPAGIVRYDVLTGEKLVLVEDVHLTPMWVSPDNRWVAFLSEDRPHRVRVDGSRLLVMNGECNELEWGQISQELMTLICHTDDGPQPIYFRPD